MQTGLPYAGEAISFATTNGTLKDKSVETDESGVATTTLFAPKLAGAATVTASYGLISQTAQVSFKIPTGVGDISLKPYTISGNLLNPAEVVADGTSQVKITATVKDNSGNVIEGVSVSFGDASNVREAIPLPANNIYKGTGAKTTDPFYCRGGSVNFTFLHMGSSYFTVYARNEETNVRTLILLSSGRFQDRTESETLEEGIYYLEIMETSDTWEITIEGNVEGVPEGKTEPLGVVVTDDKGEASYIYTSSKVAKVVTIRAEIGEIFTATQITQKPGSAAQVEVSVSPAEIYANGVSQGTVTVNVRDVNNNLVNTPASVTLKAATSGISDSPGKLEKTTLTTEDGKATTKLTSPISPVPARNVTSTITGTITSGGNTISDTIDVKLIGVSLSDMIANPGAILPNGTATSSITVRLRNAEGIAVAGETVTFTATAGTLKTQTAVTDETGIATVTLIAPDVSGTGTVKASYGLIEKSTTVSFQNPGVIIGGIVLSSGAPSIVADGKTQTLLSAKVTDNDGKPVKDGIAVNFNTTSGTISNITATSNGTATALLTSSTIVGTATVTASVGGVSQSTAVKFIPGSVARITLTALPNNLVADGKSTSDIKASVVDSNGNAVDAELISFSVNGSGTLSAPTATTSGGTASVTYKASNQAPATDTITAKSTNGTTATTFVTLIDPTTQIGSVTLTSGSPEIVANGTSQTLISATVNTSTGTTIKDGTAVSFTATAGTIQGTAYTTNGVATALLTSSKIVGTATVTGTIGGISGTAIVKFIPGSVNKITLTATPETLAADGVKTSQIKADVRDAYGNAIDGEVISFTITAGKGTLSVPTATTSGGVATVTYTTSLTADKVTITAKSANGISSTVDISLTPTDIGTMTISATPQTINVVIGESTPTSKNESKITATIKYSEGNPVAGFGQF